MRRFFVPVALGVAALGCGSADTRTVRLVRVAPDVAPECGAPDGGRTLLVTALGDFPPSEATGRPVNLSDVDQASEFSIESFPGETRMLEVVVIGAGGVTATIGRTAELDLLELDDGDELPVFMAPPRGFCPTGGGDEAARIEPLVIAAGDGALVAGGVDGSGAAVTEVAYYDAAAGAFASLGDALYGDGALGMTGAAVAALPDGRVAVSGGAAPAFQVFDPEERAFSVATFLPNPRARHAAVALDDERLLLAGGCAQLDGDGLCRSDLLLTTTTVLDLETGEVTPGPDLDAVRIDGAAFLEPDGRVLIAGGVDESGAPVTTAERIDPDGGAPEVFEAAGGAAARLADGGVLLALGPGGAAADGASVIPVGGTGASAVTSAPRVRAGATMTPLDDGRVLILGGLEDESGAEALLYEPGTGSFAALAAVPDVGGGPVYRRDHAAALLPDGTVLVVGGRAGGDALADAWIFRPDLTGPYSSDATVGFDAAGGDLTLLPRDPARFRREPGGGGLPPSAVIEASGGGGALPSQWALVGGPRFAEVTLSARLRVEAGGAALIAGFEGAGDYGAVVLSPGQRAQLYRVAGGQALTDETCTGQAVDTSDLAPDGGGLATVTLDLRADLTVTVDGTTVLTCTGLDPLPRGLVGIGPTGDGGAELRFASLTLGR